MYSDKPENSTGAEQNGIIENGPWPYWEILKWIGEQIDITENPLSFCATLRHYGIIEKATQEMGVSTLALDGIVIRAIVHQLQSCIGGRINKIYQPGDHDLILQLRAQGANRKLLLSANPTYPRMHYTEASYANPLEAPMFCMLMRKHCEGGMIEAVEQVGLERIVRIRVRKLDELGDASVKTIVIELMGRHSNVILLDQETGTILDGIHHVTPAISSYRVVMPGSAYIAPPDQGKRHPLEVDRDEFFRLLSDLPASHEAEGQTGQPAAKQLAERLVQSFSGLSPLIARELVFRAGEPPTLAALWTVFQEAMEDVRHHRYAPAEVLTSDGKSHFYVLPLTHLEGERTAYATVSECLDHYYGEKAVRDMVKQKAGDLIQLLQNERSKSIKKLGKLEETLKEAQDADRYRKMGELVTAYMHQIQKGDDALEAIDYYDEAQPVIRIPLDPMLSPAENAQRYFKKYNKLKNSQVAAAEQIEQTKEEIVYLESVLQQLDMAGLEDLEEIREELAQQGYVKQRRNQGAKKKKTAKPSLSCFLSSENIPIYVGKNNTQNEYLTNRLADPSDTWLHTKDIPGSHVVIRSRQYGEATLHEAAMLAAYYSQAKSSSNVPVDYTLIRYVKKPNGAKPGFVIYERQKTLFVTPDEAVIKALRPCKP